MYTLEEKQIGRFTVVVFADWDTDWDFALGDEPVLIFAKTRGRFDVLFDESKQVPQALDVLASVEDADWEEVLASVYGLDWDVLEDGRVRVDWTGWDRPRTFKTLESATRRVLEDDSGLDLEDVKVERFSTRDAEVYVAWSQKELDRYAGTKDASAPLKTVRSYLDGEVYGWNVEDADGDVLESCWGFIGDWEDCMAEGESVARGLEADALAEDAKTQDKTQDALTGRHAVRVYTLDGIKDGEADFDGTGPVPVRTLDGTVSVRVPRPVASRKTLEGDVICTC